MKIYVTSLGCKLNQSEVEAMMRSLQQAGHAVVDEPAKADLCVVNSCAVTHVAARKTRQVLRRLRGQCPSGRVAVLGCYADLWPGELTDISGVQVLSGAAAKEDLGEVLRFAQWQPGVRCGPHEGYARRRTRALVKVQDGCNNHCTYCVVRLARGPERSRTLSDIVSEVDALVSDGVQEIVLTGVHVGAYGQGTGLDLRDLIQALFAETELPRLRLSSIEPWHVREEYFDLWQEPRLCRHLHLPLQSGSDFILRRMGRRYSISEFTGVVERARRRIPDLAITTDVMVGFPGEGEWEFQESLDFVRQIGFSRLHVFRFSRRPGTAAASFPDQVPVEIAEQRSQLMREVGLESSRHFHRSLLGKQYAVLWESRDYSSNMWEGLTDNYVRVRLSCEADLHNRILPATLISLDDEGVVGQLALTENDLTSL